MAKDPILGLVEYPESHFDPFERKEFILKLIPAPMTGKIVKSEFFGNKTRFDLLQQVKSRIEENLRDKDPPPLSPDLVEKAVTTIFGEDSKIFKVFDCVLPKDATEILNIAGQYQEVYLYKPICFDQLTNQRIVVARKEKSRKVEQFPADFVKWLSELNDEHIEMQILEVKKFIKSLTDDVVENDKIDFDYVKILLREI